MSGNAQISPQTAQNAPERPKTRQRACVRCGANPRAPDRFCCEQCLASPALREEIAQAKRRSFRNLDERKWLVAHAGWKGGWGRGT